MSITEATFPKSLMITALFLPKKTMKLVTFSALKIEKLGTIGC